MGEDLEVFTRAVNHLYLILRCQKGPQCTQVLQLQRVDQVRLCSPAQLNKGNLRKKRIATPKFGVNRNVLSGCVRRQYLT